MSHASANVGGRRQRRVRLIGRITVLIVRFHLTPKHTGGVRRIHDACGDNRPCALFHGSRPCGLEAESEAMKQWINELRDAGDLDRVNA